MKNVAGRVNRLKRRNFGLLGIGTILFAILIATPALADPGQFTGCLNVPVMSQIHWLLSNT